MTHGRIFMAALALSIATFASATQQSQELCSGILEENNAYIPSTVIAENGMTEATFNAVIDRAYDVYAPLVAAKGGHLEINKNWDDGTVNAYANRNGDTWTVNMFGGLARHDTITEDGLLLVVCHELGHHLGGAPKYGGWWSDWASNEGQADYFANLKCMRRMFTDKENADFVASHDIPATVKDTCESLFNTTPEENVCIRGSLAGLSVANLFAAIRDETTLPSFDTPDTDKVSETNDAHPATQCRLDTYYNGSLCTASLAEDVDDSNPVPGSCNLSQGFEKGTRPLCWFSP